MANQEVWQSTVAKKPRFFYGYIIVLFAFIIMMVMWGTLYTFGVFFEPLSTEFGWTRAATSGAYSLFMVLHGLLYIVAGRLNDKYGPRIVITVLGFFLGLGYLLMSQVSTIWQLYVFYGVLVGIGMSGFVPLVSTISRWFVKRRGVMTGIVASGVGVGTLIIPPVANWLISNYGWRSSYIIVGLIALVLVILAAQFLRRDPRQMGQVPYGEKELLGEGLDLQDGGLAFREAIHTRQFWMLGVMLFCFMVGIQTVMVHIVPHATGLGISPAAAANILAAIGGVGIIGRITMGAVADRIGSKPALIIGFILVLGVLFFLTVAKETWMLFLFAIIFGFSYGGFVSLESLLVAELFGMSSHGIILGSVIFAATIGGAVGPVMAGHIFDTVGSYQLAFLVCAALAVIATILAWFLRPIANKGRQVT